jgi:hypothetical protein
MARSGLPPATTASTLPVSPASHDQIAADSECCARVST